MATVYSKGTASDGPAGGQGSFWRRVENALMGMWHMMTETRGQASASAMAITVLLLLFDTLTSASLIVHPDSYLAAYLRVTIHDILPAENPTVFLAVYIAVLAIVSFALADGMFVAWSFHIGHFRSLWPAHVLRAFIGIIGTALYNPFLEVLILPLRCSELAHFYLTKSDLAFNYKALGPDSDPWTAHDASGLTCPPVAQPAQLQLLQAVASSVSVLALVLFIPFALSTQLVYIDPDPSSEVWDALSNGRELVWDSVMRTLLVGITFFIKPLDVTAHAVLSLLMLLVLHARLVKSLPFFRTSANMARSALYGLLIWLAFESLVLASLRRFGHESATVQTASLACCALWPLATLIACLLPLPQYAHLTRGLRAVMMAVEQTALDKAFEDARNGAHQSGSVGSSVNDGAGGLTLAASRVSEPASGSTAPANSERRGGLRKTQAPPPIGDGIILAFNRFMTKVNSCVPGRLRVLDTRSATMGSFRNSFRSAGGQVVTLQSIGNAGAAAGEADMMVSVRKGRSKDAVEAAERFGGEAEHVEAMALLALRTNWQPGTMTHSQHTANCSAGLFSKKAISVAESVFEHGLLAFPGNPGVRVAYARFLASYSQDSVRAIAVLQTALRCNPRLEDRFALFSFGRTLDQQRQSNDLGEGEMDAVGVIAFRQMNGQALLHHHEAVKSIHELWTMIIALQAQPEDSGVDGTPGRQSMATKLTEQIAKIVHAKQLAQADYEKLLLRYPNAALLLRSYQAFATDVMCDPALARNLSNRIDALERPEGAAGGKDEPVRELGEKSSFVGSVGTKKSGGQGSGSAASRGAARRAARKENSSSMAIADMRLKMQVSLFVLLSLAVTIFAVAMFTMDDYSRLIDVIQRASTRRYNIVALAFHTRTLTLAAGVITKSGFNPTIWCRPGELCTTSFELARQLTIQFATEMQRLNADLYEPGNPITMFPAVKSIYDEPTRYLALQVLEGPPPLNTTVRTSLLSMLVKYAGNSLAVAQMPVTRLAQCTYHYCLDPVVWRYIQDNWVTALEGANEVSELYIDSAFSRAGTFAAVAFSLLAVVVVVLFVSWSCVFWPAAIAVQRTNAGVTGISASIPNDAVKALVKRYERLESQLAQLASQLSDNKDGVEGADDADDDGFSDRGLGDGEDDESAMPVGSQLYLGRQPGENGGSFASFGGKMSGSSQPSTHTAPIRVPHDHAPVNPPAAPAHHGSPQLASLAVSADPNKGSTTTGHHVHQAPLTARGGSRSKRALHHAHSVRDVKDEAEREMQDLARAGTAAEEVLGMILNENRAFKKDMVELTSPRTARSPSRAAVSLSVDSSGTGAGLLQGGMPGASTAAAPRPPLHRNPPSGVAAIDTVNLPGSLDTGDTVHTASHSDSAAVKPSTDYTADGPLPNSLTVPASIVVHAVSPAHADGSTGGLRGRRDSKPSFMHSLANAPGLSSDDRAHLVPGGISAADEQQCEEQAVTHAVTVHSSSSSAPVVVVQRGASKRRVSQPSGGAQPSSSDAAAPGATTTGARTMLNLKSVSHDGVQEAGEAGKGGSKGSLVPHEGMPEGSKVCAERSRRASVDKGEAKRSVVRRVSLRAVDPSSSSGVAQLGHDSSHSHMPKLKHAGPATVRLCCCKLRVSDGTKETLDSAYTWTTDTWTSMVLLAGGKKNLLSPLLRSLSQKVALAMLLVLGLQTLSAILSYDQVLNGAYTAPAINIAGYRRELTITSTFHSRELLIGPDIIGTYSFAVDVMRKYVDRLEKYHTALLKGSTELRVRPSQGTDPAQDRLIDEYDDGLLSRYEQLQKGSQLAMIQAGRSVDGANITERDALIAETAGMGMHYLIMRYIDACNSWLATYEPWLASDTPENREIVRKRYGVYLTASIAQEAAYLNPDDGVDYRKSVRHNMTLLYTFPKYRELEIMSFGLLDARLLRSLQLYLQQVTTSFSQSTIVQVVVIVLNFAVIIFLQFGVFATQFKNLAAEAQRTEELVKLIPKPVLAAVPKLRALVVSSIGPGALPADDKNPGR